VWIGYALFFFLACVREREREGDRERERAVTRQLPCLPRNSPFRAGGGEETSFSAPPSTPYFTPRLHTYTHTHTHTRNPRKRRASILATERFGRAYQTSFSAPKKKRKKKPRVSMSWCLYRTGGWRSLQRKRDGVIRIRVYSLHRNSDGALTKRRRPGGVFYRALR
jgi:hypothetical protein